MIQVTLLSGLKRLLNPAFIQEVGNYHCDARGFAVPADTQGAEVRTFVLMSGGADPIDVVENPAEIANLRTVWKHRDSYFYVPVSRMAFVLFDDEGDLSVSGITPE